MKKIILIGINARYTHSNLALYSLRSYVAGLCPNVVIREFSINRNIAGIINAIKAEKADVVALSVYIWNAEIVKRIIPSLKQSPVRPVLVLGGPEVSYNPDSWLASFPEIDYIITGPGEAAFRRLLDQNLTSERKIISFPNPPFPAIPMPYTDEDLVSLKNKYLYYESSRGCSFRCTYCLSSRGDQKFEAKDPELVKNELRRILCHEPRIVKFVDRTFNAPGGPGREIWNFLLDRYCTGPTLFHFEVHPRFLDDDDIRLLSRAPAGKFQFEIGVQSTSPGTRAIIRRGPDWNTEKLMIRRLIGLGTIRIHLDLIAGLPGDDINALADTFNDLYRLGPDHLQVGILKLLPGTEMRERAEEYGMAFHASPPYAVTRTAWLAEDLMRTVNEIAFLTDRIYNTRRFSATLTGLVRRFPGPFSLYRELTLFRGRTGGPGTRKWEEAASFLLGFVRESFPGDEDYFLDTLRWDWCSTARSHRIPEIIRPCNAADIKKKGIVFFSRLAAGDTIRFRDESFAAADLKRSLFFRARTEQFASEYMDDHPCALFLPVRKKIILYNDPGRSV